MPHCGPRRCKQQPDREERSEGVLPFLERSCRELESEAVQGVADARESREKVVDPKGEVGVGISLLLFLSFLQDCNEDFF